MRRVSDETVDRLALDLLNEADPLRKLGLTKAFGHRPFPKGHQWLLPLVNSDDESMRIAAIRALAQIAHDDVRELAFAGAASDMRPDLVAELMIRNARAGDEPFLLDLARRDLDPDIYHWTSMGIRRTLESHRLLDPRRIGTELYERDACSMCRQGVVELVMNAGPLPVWMLAELPFDSERGTRDLVSPK